MLGIDRTELEARLRRGDLVAFPTETVYGVGADASSPSALRRLYTVKRRPLHHPVIVHIGDAEFFFAAGESILTEYSYKYDLRDLRDLAGAAGFAVERVWLDEDRYFSVQYLTVRSGGSAAGE